MTEDKELRQAIEICKQDMKHNPFTPDLQKGYKLLLSLAERYLAGKANPLMRIDDKGNITQIECEKCRGNHLVDGNKMEKDSTCDDECPFCRMEKE